MPSRAGFAVRTTRGYWSLITAVKHPSLIGREGAVIRTLVAPDQVRLSRVDGSVYLFYRKHGKQYVCVVTRRIDANTGFIMTAYVTEKIKEGKVLWKK